MDAEHELKVLLEQANIGLIIADRKGKIIRASSKIAAELGYTREELENLSFLDITFEEDLERSRHVVAEVFDCGQATSLAKRYRCKNGETLNTVVKVNPVAFTQKGPNYSCVTIEPLSDNGKDHVILKSRLQRAEAMLETSLDAAIEHDVHGNIVSCNHRTYELFKIKDETTTQLNVEQLIQVTEGTEQLPYLSWVANNKDSANSENYTGVRSDNSQFDLELSTSSYLSNGEKFYSVFIRDISDRKKTERELVYLATHDVLTGLANRSCSLDFLQHCIEQYQNKDTNTQDPEREPKYALLFLDLDDFKDVNDSLGHSIGDKMLKSIGQRIKQAAGEQSFVARVGGDEFIIVVTEDLYCDSSVQEQAEVIAANILNSVNQTVNVERFDIVCSASIGIACYPRHGGSANALLKHADIAMYQAKNKGKNNFAMFDLKMEQNYTRKLSLEAQLKKAIKNDELTAFYQPKFCLNTMQVTGVEVLARWFKGSGASIPPSEFIPIAESSGFILDFGEYFLEKACSEFKELYQNDRFSGRLAINVSNLQFSRKLYYKELMESLKRTGFEASNLELEITESTIIQNFEYSTELIQRLQADNITIAMDDFGVGYSSLSYLQKLPVNCVKLDKSFVNDIATSDKAKLMVEFIIDLAKKLGLHVVAEGTETLDQLTALQAMGCDSTQGYYLSKPLSLVRLKQLIENNDIATNSATALDIPTEMISKKRNAS